jgi:hypothetical protein
MYGLVSQLIIQLREAIQRNVDVVVEHSQECDGVGLVPPLHVSMVLGGLPEQILQ